MIVLVIVKGDSGREANINLSVWMENLQKSYRVTTTA